MNSISLLLLPPAAYLIGSVPFGLVFTRFFTKVDLRRQGSRNIGATNVRRTAGTFWGVLTLLCDALKGAVPVAVACHLSAFDAYPAMVALASFFGHLFPVYLGFKGGGKGVATAFGCFAVLSPMGLTVGLLVFVLLVCMTGRVSAGSLAGSAVLPLSVWKATGSAALVACAVILAAGIFLRHRENIRRLIAGSEPRL